MDYTKRTERFHATYPENENLYNWLRKEEPEPVIEPDLPIIDTHHHFWDHRRPGNPSTTRTHAVYLLPECLEDMYDGHKVVKTVYTQAGAYFRSSRTYSEGRFWST